MKDTTFNFPDNDIKILQNEPDLDPLIERVGDAQIVMLGESSHGTHEFYTWRAKISKRLIEEKGFSTIVVEGDWPDCIEINNWIKKYKNSGEPIQETLKHFGRWPTWMWANWEIGAFANWLRDYNSGQQKDDKVGFYGMDVYSLWNSLNQVMKYLEKEDPEAAKKAKKAWECFEPYQALDNYVTVFNNKNEDCRKEAINLLQEVQRNSFSYDSEPEAGLNAEINALVVANAENYYKAMAYFDGASWNVRDRHMMETLDTIKKHQGYNSKIIVWAHNTHIGDARATNMREQGLVNIGQLARQQYGKSNVVLVGFGTNSGTVMAGKGWGAPMQVMEVPRAKEGSFENILHTRIGENILFVFNENTRSDSIFSEKIKHRAIGVVYNPENEWGNYVPSVISQRYDAFIYIDETKAVHPIRTIDIGLDMPDTYPFGL